MTTQSRIPPWMRKQAAHRAAAPPQVAPGDIEEPATEESAVSPPAAETTENPKPDQIHHAAPQGAESPPTSTALSTAAASLGAKEPAPSPTPPLPVELPDPWSDELDKKHVLARKRSLPRKAKVVLAGLGATLVLAVWVSRRGASAPDTSPTLKLQDDMIIPDEDLKRRREVTAYDFRPKRPFLHTEPSERPQSAETTPIDVERRRHERAADPEDVASLRRSDRSSSPVRGAARTRRPARPLFLEETPASPDQRMSHDGDSFPSPYTPRRSRRTERPLVPAGTAVAATLLTPIRLPDGNPTVVAKLTEGGILPAGTRVLGIASLSDDRVDIVFRRLVLPGGDEFTMRGQAQDQDGGFGLSAAVTHTDEDEEAPSLARDVAVDATSELAQGLLGGGILGRAGSSYIRGKNQRSYRHRGGGSTAMLPAGTELVVFFEESTDR